MARDQLLCRRPVVALEVIAATQGDGFTDVPAPEGVRYRSRCAAHVSRCPDAKEWRIEHGHFHPLWQSATMFFAAMRRFRESSD